ncbi:MAG: DNA-directed RNA polymerase subunit omega [Oscillospiraceae bacterium]|nr:DNA-directed RNA polymerase subunit omega [Oscillospiraceae bacterium]
MMLYPAMNKLTAHVPNRYLLVNVVARRARQIAQEAEIAGEKMNVKSVTLAIQEVADGKLTLADAKVEVANVEG